MARISEVELGMFCSPSKWEFPTKIFLGILSNEWEFTYFLGFLGDAVDVSLDS